ncbi:MULTISPECIES: ATP-binding protein [unclassified Guyparkeria]|uniref:Lon protease family protein n=1 Tax=unclassified Guyparkeria TaxID=2626246 RepID=UPI00073360E7|nr:MULTISPECIES: ATP-binding protein [unclassified Guyparkeria]KTG17514.1 ATP-dependent protease [Guyparkeria sp. XI15]OAE88329.1 ATP-dependent protease [Guyparkeria sp. WRN-7]
MADAPARLDADLLYRPCHAGSLPFRSTADLEPPDAAPGQERALEALEFGTEIEDGGFNLYALGSEGLGKYEVVRDFLEKRARAHEPPPSWAYVFNFEHPDRPRLLELPAKAGRELKKDLETLVSEFGTAIPAVFESDEYHNRIQELREAFKRRQREAIEAISKEAEERHVAMVSTPSGFTLGPYRDGKILDPEAFHELPEEEQEEWQAAINELEEKLKQTLQQIPKWQKEASEQLQQLNEEMLGVAVGQQLETLERRWVTLPAVTEYLGAIRDDIISHVNDLDDEGSTVPEEILNQYQLNLIVDNADLDGAPVIYEDLPTHARLIGRIEHYFREGALLTDFRLIRSGALHRANGGYLILHARHILMQPFAWETLKRALYGRQVRIESLEQLYAVFTTTTLEPDPLPLEVKVVLVGDRLLYYLLSEYDPDFARLFKVQADFEDSLARQPENEMDYARTLAAITRRDGLRALDRGAVARAIEHASRLAGDREKLAAGTRPLSDLLAEANHLAGSSHAEQIGARHIEAAIRRHEKRAERLRERAVEAILRETINLPTHGERIAAVNGLAVSQLGDFTFGLPTRITATARPGRDQVVDIERQAKLGGNIHAKAVMILSRYLASRYAPDGELSLSASLAFEQLYGSIEGDSASVAELCALVSAIARVPIRQSFAVTGSMNQLGEVQAIGGVNEKIEGFFRICRERGLDGQHGVIIPRTNLPHLMLDQEVRGEVAAGRFQIYAISHVDEALQLLTGMEPGEADADGHFPADSLNRRVVDRLARFERATRHDHDRHGSHDEHG